MEEAKVAYILSKLPFIFEKNIGQHHRKVQFLLTQKGCTTFFTDSEIVLTFIRREDEKNEAAKNLLYCEALKKTRKYKSDILRIRLENSNKIPQIIGKNEFNCRLNYFDGKVKEEWRANIPLYKKVLYKDVYPQIDVIYYGNNGKLECDFIASPGTDISNICLSFDGAEKIKLDEDNNLMISINENELTLLRPRVYQKINGDEIEIESSFIIKENCKVAFNIEEYNQEETLIIDTKLMYGTFIASSNMNRGNSIVVGEDQCAYITGVTSIHDFPLKNVYQSSCEAIDYSAYIVKIDTRKSGQASLVYSSYIGGNGIDVGMGIAADCDGVAYITGATTSTSGFPITNNGYSTKYLGGENTGFLVKIDTTKVGFSSLVYGTYLGGNGYDYASSVALDKSNNAYITGFTNSNLYFPTTSNAYIATNENGIDYGFIIKLDTNKKGKDSLIYGTYFGGSSYDYISSVALDCNDYIYVTGVTKSEDFPVTANAYRAKRTGELSSTFLSKFDLSKGGKKALIYSSYLSGNGADAGYGVVVDFNQCAYITGATTSIAGFPITNNAYETKNCNSNGSGFFIKINTKLSGEKSLEYGTYLCGSNLDLGSDIKVDCNGYAYIVGFTSSNDFPVSKNGYQSNFRSESYSIFLIKLDTSKNGKESLLYGTYLGGNRNDFALSMALDKKLNVYITGYTESISDFPITSNVFQAINPGGEDSTFLIKLGTRVCNLIAEKNSYKNDIKVGDDIQYTIKIVNYGPDIADDVVVTDVLDEGVILKDINASKGVIKQVSNKILWTIDSVQIDEILIATVKIKIGVNYKNIFNDVIVTSDANKSTIKNKVNENNYCII